MDLVVGATGVLGAHLVYALLKQGRQVRVISSTGENPEDLKQVIGYYSNDIEVLYSEVDWFDADVLDISSLYDALDGVDTVFNCATLLNVKYTNHRNMIEDHIQATKNLVSVSIDSGISYFCHVSSTEALGVEPDYKEITEQSQRDPKVKYTGYSQCKFLCEMEVWRGFEEGLVGGIVNPATIIGAGNWNFGVPSMFRSLAKGMLFYTMGVTGFVGVLDVVRAMMQMSRAKISGERFILCCRSTSFYLLAKTIAGYLGVKPPRFKAGRLILGIQKLLSNIKPIYGISKMDFDNGFIDYALGFKIYNNSKSLGRIIVDYQDLDQVVEDVCNAYLRNVANRHN